MGSGKTALGKQLAELLQTGYLDIDEMFEERFHISIYDFFQKYDEDNFRRIERELLHETAHLENTVISTGGGTPCFFDNMKFISEHGISVYLRMTSLELADRLQQVRKKRPLLKGLSPHEFEDWISSQLTWREEFYNQATHIFYPLKEPLSELVLKLR